MQVLYRSDHKLEERVLWSEAGAIEKAAKWLFLSSQYNVNLNQAYFFNTYAVGAASAVAGKMIF